MNITVNHSLDIDEAKDRIKNLAEELKKQYGDQLKDYTEHWHGNTVNVAFRAMGVKLSGVLEVLSDKVTMNGKVPLMFKMFEKEATTKIRETLVELLSD